MKIHLEVLTSTVIKRKKPWSQVIWLGKERESLFLLDGNRVSVLYVPSGKTKRNITKLSALLSEAVCLTSTTDGLHLLGIQSSGEVFIWQKDSDELKTICGLSGLLLSEGISLKGNCRLFSSVDCTELLLVIDFKCIFLWQQDQADLKNHTLSGKWLRVPTHSGTLLPLPDNKEASTDATFYNSEVFGKCCQLSIVFNKNKNVHVTTLLIHFDKLSQSIKQDKEDISISCTWSHIDLSLKNSAINYEPISMQGAFVCQYTHNGQILAVGINQKSPAHTSVLFVSPFIQTVLISDIKGAGVKDPASKRGRQYWIAELKWTSNNLFLVLMLNNGSAGILSRLGELLILISQGCSVHLGPAYFLPFTPLISVQSNESNNLSNQVSLNSDYNVQHQKFSVSTHPSLPLVLFSDGYVVTVVSLPPEVSQMIFMRDLVLESSVYLKLVADTNRLDLTLANAYSLPAGESESVKQTPRVHKNRQIRGKSYSFEDLSVSLNETLDSEVSMALGLEDQAVFDISSGKIVFGETEAITLNEDSIHNEPKDTLKALHLARQNLLNVWKLAASSTELWSANMDKVVNHAVHNIVKLFSLILDCPQVEELLEASGKDLQINTKRLFQVVSFYKLLMDILQFDCQQRYLLPSVLHLSHKLSGTILSSVGLSQSDPRIKTLTGCFTLLKFTEKSLLNTYVVIPHNLKSKSLVAVSSDGEVAHHLADKDILQLDKDLTKRMTSTWKLLFKAVLQYMSSNDVSAQAMRQAHTLKQALEQNLVEMDIDMEPVQIPEISSGERYSLDGRHTMAIQAWQKQLNKNPEVQNTKSASKVLHSLFYTYILRNDLTAALSFVDSLIGKAKLNFAKDLNPDEKDLSLKLQPSLMTFITKTLRVQALHEPDMIPCIRDRAIRQLVQSLARFMAAYFSNQTVFIFPPHNPAPLPAVHYETSIANSRIIPKYHEDIVAIVRHQKLSEIWSVERTLEYLLLSGLVCEAVWFADRMGDWKSAYQLSVAHVIHRRIARPLYTKVNKPLSLPDWLSPDGILRRRLDKLVKIDFKSEQADLDHMTSILESISLAGLMGYTEVGCWLLQDMVNQLKAIVKLFTPLVCKEFYLPAPPAYCPQPPRIEKTFSLEAEDESQLRERVSSVLQLTLCVLNAAHLSIPLVGWYVQELNDAHKKAAQFKANTEGSCINFPDVLSQYLESESELSPMIEDSSVQSIMSSFRDLCTLLWLLHVRDQLSLCLRYREKHLSLGLDVENNEQWLRECFTSLQWAINLVPYSHYLADEASIYKVILALLQDLPATEDTANILAEHLYDIENLHPEVQERLERLMASWQCIILKPVSDGKSVGDRLLLDLDTKKTVSFLGSSPRGLSLSVYFYKQCQVMEKVLKKKQHCFGTYEEFVFSESKNVSMELNIGSRPFETRKSFIDFLDTFVDLRFTHIMEVSSQKTRVSRLPLLQVFAEDVVSHEMKFFSQRVPMQIKSSGLSITSGISQALNRAANERKIHQRSSSLPRRRSFQETLTSADDSRKSKKLMPVGLFRGNSMIEIPVERSHAVVYRAESEPCLDDIHYIMGVTPSSTQAGGSQQNISGMASRFAMSRETIQPSSFREGDKLNWSLTVNFGQKYTTLQQLVEWLELWGKKSFGCVGMEDILEIPAKIRLNIPAQLILLSLWLLEYKYGSSQQDVAKGSSLQQSSKHLSRSRSSSSRRQSTNKPARYNRKIEHLINLFLKSPVTESKLQDIQSIRQQAPLHQPTSHSATRNKTPAEKPFTPTAGSIHSLTSLEHDDIINAYTQVLDGKDDSSSLEVSSLASDELDDSLMNTLNVLRESALNKTVFPKDESPERVQSVNSAPNQTIPSAVPKVTSPHARHILSESVQTMSKQINEVEIKHQTERKELSEIKLRSQVTEEHEIKPRSQLTEKHEIKPRSHVTEEVKKLPNANQVTIQIEDGSMAHQIQSAIREEFRRILEVQQKSVLAMMGAIDETTAEVISTSSSSNMQLHHNSSPPTKSKIMKSVSGLQQLTSAQTEMLVNTENRTTESFPSQENVANLQSSPYKSVHTRQMREALLELQNLQAEVRNLPEHTSSLDKINQDKDVSELKEEKLKLPLLSLQAWTEQIKPAPVQLPLLHCSTSAEVQEPFKFLSHYLPQFQQKLFLKDKVSPAPQFLHIKPQAAKFFHQSSSHKADFIHSFHGNFHPPPPSNIIPPPLPSNLIPPPPPSNIIPPPLPSNLLPPPHPSNYIPPPPPSNQIPPPPPSYYIRPLLFSNLIPPPPPSTHFPPSSTYFQPSSQQAPFPTLSLANYFLPSQPPAPETNSAYLNLQNFPQNFPLLRIIPPESSRNITQETKQRLLHQFHQHVLENPNVLPSQQEPVSTENFQLPSLLAETDKPKMSESIPGQHSAEVQTSDTAQDLTEDKVDASTSDTRINAGFALPRGLFESYLQLGEHLIGPEANETNAAFQLKMAQAMQRQMERKIRTRVDFSTMTQEQIDTAMATDPAMEVIRTAEAATSITKDTGVDPVEEVLNDYNLKRHNNVLPPDIFMGLRFADQNLKSSEIGKGRSYLNVVDIAAASVLRDIPERTDDTQNQEVIDSAILTSKQTVEQMSAIEESLREKFQSKYSVVSPRKHDQLTVGMFTDLHKENLMSISIIPQNSVSQPKSTMLRHLHDMSNQLKAIDEMSQNIEREFKSSHLLLSTIQDVNASLQRSRSPSPDRLKSPQRPPVKFQEEKSVTSTKTSLTSPQVSARSLQSKTSSSLGSLHGSHGHLSEFIQEVLSQGVQSDDYSEEIVLQVERDTREKLHKEFQLSGDQLINAKTAEERIKKKSPEEREKLKKWMTEKFHQRQEEYKRRRNELIEREPKPFKSQSTITKLNLKTLEENLNEKRMNMATEFMEQRLIEAGHLMDNILVDKPDIPWTLDFQPKKRKVANVAASSKSPTKKIESSSFLSRDQEVSTPSLAIRSRLSTKDSTPVKGILKVPGKASVTDLYLDNQALSSITEVDHSIDSSQDIINYAKKVVEMDNRDLESTTTSYLEPHKFENQKHGSYVDHKSQVTSRKSFASMVRLQRPETTRKWSELNRKRQCQDEQDKFIARQEAVKKSAVPKTKVLGSRKLSAPVVPRRVKTYSERLQEMKLKNKSSSQYHLAGVRSVSAVSSIPQSSHTSVQMRTFLRSHRPLHKPQSYTEQLQKLRSHPHATEPSSQLSKSAVVSPGSHRARPYSDPYSDVDYEELASVMSDWDVDETLQNILYGGGSLDTESYQMTDTNRSGGDLYKAYSESQSDYFDDVMRNRGPYRMVDSAELGAGDYQQSVDIEQIAEAASVASASVLSVIDWDAVEDLIKDV
ncbi:uncharacterized protein LOC106060096 isoform X2 [Biomphalaria glabrata]|uniref:Uncharacterized protein LOC106060096 isoform X2 n=1 Tax=Biomphalaria glabrata TaxID=6526 RepID=A0A9W3AHJ1_BIOGL|nr:uncharacterized protein LOC106060096 isoform X2 [Biomphalaria glabrata]